MSKGCQFMVNVGRSERGPQGFEYRGSVRELELVGFCDERGVELRAYMVVEASTDDLYEFPSLFGVGDGG